MKNGGLYIKLGQGLVSMNHILPKEYLSTLEVLQDKALHRKTNEVNVTALAALCPVLKSFDLNISFVYKLC